MPSRSPHSEAKRGSSLSENCSESGRLVKDAKKIFEKGGMGQTGQSMTKGGEKWDT